MLGRPGRVLVDGEVAGIWRPRRSGATLTVTVNLWREPTAALWAAVTEAAERLAGFRRVPLENVQLQREEKP